MANQVQNVELTEKQWEKVAEKAAEENAKETAEILAETVAQNVSETVPPPAAQAEQKTPPKDPDEATAKVLVPVDDKGFAFKNHIQLKQAASMMIQIDMAPDHLKKEGVTAVAAAMLLCRQFNLPQKAMNQMAFVKGKLTQFGSLVTALAERHPSYGRKKEFFVDADCKEICFANKNLKAEPWAAVVQIMKKGEDHWTEYFFSMDDAKTAKLYPAKEDSGWMKYTKDLLMHKARSRALRAEYASGLEGINYHEDVVEVFENARDVSPKTAKDLTEELNKVNNGTH